METYKKVTDFKCQQADITSMLYASDEYLVVGQAGGFIDVIRIGGKQATVTHSLQINEAGDINELALTAQLNELVVGCQKGLLRCRVTDSGQLEIVQVEEEYSNLYIVNVVWCGGSRFIVVTSRPKYSKTRMIPKGEKNFAIATFTLYNAEETDPEKSQIVLGHYSTSFDQACFPIVKVQVIVPRNESSVPIEE